MDVLKNKSKMSSTHISRYAPFPYYYHTLDKKFVYGVTNQLSPDTPYVEVTITPEDTFDSLANNYYGRPDYYWIIADFNQIQDSFIKPIERLSKIKVPSLSAIQYKE